MSPSRRATKAHWEKAVAAFNVNDNAQGFDETEATLIFGMGHLMEEEGHKDHAHSFQELMQQMPPQFKGSEWYKGLSENKDLIMKHIYERCMHEPITIARDDLITVMEFTELMLMEAVGFIVPQFN